MLSVNRRTGGAVKRWTGIFSFLEQSLVMAALTRASLFSDLSPFSTAWFCASLSMGHSPWPLLIGCILGSPWEIMNLLSLTPIAGCLMALGMRKALIPLIQSIRGKKQFSRDVGVCLLAFFGAFVAPLAVLLIEAGSPVPALMTALLSGIVSMAFAPVLRSAAGLSRRRIHLLDEELLSLTLVIMLALMGVNSSPVRIVALPIGALITLAASSTGAAYGAACGVITGAALSLSGIDPMLGASTGLMGLIAGAVMPLGRIWAALAFALTNLASMAFGGSGAMGTLHPVWALCVSGLYLLLPRTVLDRLSGWIVRDIKTVSPTQLSGQILHSTQKRLRALSAVFSDLAQSLGTCPAMPDEQMLIDQMRRALCRGCPGYPDCWNGTDGKAGRMLCQLLGETLAGRPLSEGDELPPEWGRICRRANIIPRKLGPLTSSFYLRRQNALLRQSEGIMLNRHFSQAAAVLDDLDASLSDAPQPDGALSLSAAAALENAGLEPEDVVVLDGENLEICATRRDGLWNREDILKASDTLSRAFDIPVHAISREITPQSVLRLTQSPRLNVTIGCASRSKDTYLPSGDSHLTVSLSGARALLALSDGMGTGAGAARESSTAIQLIKRFMLANIEPQLMFDTINQLLLTKGEEEMYATADVCILDLNKGCAHFSKLGACASFRIRGEGILRIDGGKLPLGILDSVSPAETSVDLLPGDTLVMVTDGIADGASEEQNLWLSEILRELRRLSPSKICEKVIDAASALSSVPRDDMTVLAARIQKSEKALPA